MNRIILLGNGFDLAHGLPTKYSDFITNYLKRILSTHRQYEDDNVKYSSAYNSLLINENAGVKELMEMIKEDGRISLEFKNKFLESLINETKVTNWIDIENYYYKKLIRIINWGAEPNLKAVKQLNENFETVKLLLENYLALNVNESYEQDSSLAFSKLFDQNFIEDDFGINKFYPHQLNPRGTLFLNFNYTNTINRYLVGLDAVKSPILINIHGELLSDENPIVFGFGDELDNKYAEIENYNSNELFRHIKSFMYSLSSNYQNLSRFVEDDDFQVYVVGHSCGLSDRTMLNYIFEHEKCKSIKIFYHKTEANFVTTTQEISRHFRKDKNAMRMKIVPFDKSEPCPQVQLEKIK